VGGDSTIRCRMGTVAERIDTIVDDTVAALRIGRKSSVHVRGARGAGKSWTLDRSAERLDAEGVRVLRTAGAEADRGIPFAGLSTLVRSAVAASADDWPELRAAIEFAPRQVDPARVATEAHRLLGLLASAGPLALLVDDAHLLDAASANTLSFVMRRTEALAMFTTGPDASTDAMAIELRVGDLEASAIVAMLERKGVARGAAERCASAAQGNPGLALALADGLSAEQRVGTAPVSVLPRPTGGLADELLARLRAHGEQVSRALVVAAAEPGGDGSAAQPALRTLGEHEAGLDAAEEAGLVEVVGTRMLFPDPWTRSAAYHLVAPASRRAAHRALAAAFGEPGQAAQRAWHLAAGADGPSQAVTDALLLLADDTARRGASSAAAEMAERAAEFAPDASLRTTCRLAALDRWMESAVVDGVERITAVLDRGDTEAAAAAAEADAFLRGEPAEPVPAEGDGRWARRRNQRLEVLRLLLAGDHRNALARLASTEGADPRRHIAAAIAHRHAGRVREARNQLTGALVVLEGVDCAAHRWALLVSADLDVLQGRPDDALAALDSVRPTSDEGLAEWSAAVRARAALVRDPTMEPGGAVAAFSAPASGVLGEIRMRIADGVRTRRAELLEAAASDADEHQLPLEAAEARMWRAALPGADRRMSDLVVATFQRCGARGWEPRVGAAVPPVPVAAAATDPALESLSQAERRVAEAVARGLTNREVADHLYLSVKTVDFHLQQMYRKLGIRSRTELAVRMAGFVPPTTGERG
jgi:DNA-binding CsgD family transcriptional regulator